ncbi:MAG: divalent-cation tolerance protein CutA [Pelagibacterales bacterium]|nr:divalent-cation tolerance protein CutA [Pelagibacterales bacterium]
MSEFIIIKTTYPSLTTAKKLVKFLLQEKLIACAQFQKIQSCYLWEEKITNDSEILLNLKTEKKLYSKIETIILQNHPYKIPQIICLKIANGSKDYFDWIDKNLVKTNKKLA